MRGDWYLLLPVTKHELAYCILHVYTNTTTNEAICYRTYKNAEDSQFSIFESIQWAKASTS